MKRGATRCFMWPGSFHPGLLFKEESFLRTSLRGSLASRRRASISFARSSPDEPEEPSEVRPGGDRHYKRLLVRVARCP